MVGIALAFACALGWGAFDAWRKRLAAVVPARPLLVLLSLGHVPIFVVWAVMAGGALHGSDYWPYGLGSVALNIVGNLAFLHSLRIGALSRTIPLLAFVPVFAAGLALVALEEVPTPGQGAGIGAVVVGALGLGADARRGRGPLALAGALARERGASTMLLTAAAWAGTLVLDKHALLHADPSVHGLCIVIGMSVVLGLGLAISGELWLLRRVGQSPGTFGVALVLGAAAMAIQLVALPLLMLALLEAIKRAVGLLSSVLLGRLMFDEAITATKVVAVLVMAGGAALVLLTG